MSAQKSYTRGTFYTFGYIDSEGNGVPLRDKVAIIDRRNAQAAVLDAQKHNPDKKIILLVSTSAQRPYSWEVWTDDRQTKIDLIARNFEHANDKTLTALKEMHESDRDALANFLKKAQNDFPELHEEIVENYEMRIQDIQDYVDAVQTIMDEQEAFIQDIIKNGYHD